MPGDQAPDAEGATEMMTQEEFMDVVALRRQGWTITDIAAEVGRHPDTISKWLRAGGPPAHRLERLRCPPQRCGALAGRRSSSLHFPSGRRQPRGTGRNRRGRRVTAEAVDRPFAHVKRDDRHQVGMRRDPRGDGDPTCKIAGIAFTGSNPVPAT